MHTVVLVVHIIACLFLIGVVLLQQGKGADMGAVFGGSSSTIFGSGGAGNFLTRMTTVMAFVFMLTSLTLTYTSARRVTSTVFDSAPSEPPPLQPPANPAAGEGAAAPAAPQAAEPQAAVPPAVAPQGAAPAEPAAAPAAAPAAEPQAAAPAPPAAPAAQ